MTRRSANLLLLVAALLWGAGNVAQQTVLQHMGPITVTGLKCFIAAAVILPFCCMQMRVAEPLGWRGIGRGLLVVVSFAVASVAMQTAYGLTSVTNAGFLINTSTVLVPIACWLMLRQRAGTKVWFAAAATFSGVFLMSGGRFGAVGAGDLLCLVSAACFALWMVFLSEFVIRHGRAFLVTMAQFGATAVICLPWGIAMEAPTAQALATALPELLLIGGVSTAGGFLLQAVAQRYTSASEAAVIVSAEAVFGSGLAVLLLGETYDAGRGLGALLIIGGIIMLQVPDGWWGRRFGARRHESFPTSTVTGDL